MSYRSQSWRSLVLAPPEGHRLAGFCFFRVPFLLSSLGRHAAGWVGFAPRAGPLVVCWTRPRRTSPVRTNAFFLARRGRGVVKPDQQDS